VIGVADTSLTKICSSCNQKVIPVVMYNIIYNKEILDTANTKEEAEYIAAEYNCAFRQNGAVVYEKVPL